MINTTTIKKTMNKSRLLTVYTLSLAFILFCTVSSFANEKEELERLTNTDRVLSSPYELHLLADRSAMINSTVSLDHEDAWLFFDNIRPEEVIGEYGASILINGEPLNAGANGRVAIYGHGTVVMPHGYGFQPLTVFSEENFGGTPLALNVNSMTNELGELDNVIRSFKLKRGYMATFANEKDGTGYSRVFIADKEDLLVDVMPDELYGTVSFIRLLNHQWVSKKGWCGWNADEIQMANVTCYYDWNVGGTTTANYEYTPIRQNGGWPSWGEINGKQDVSHLLGFNEPDRPDQANMTFQEMIDQWPEMMKSGLRVGSPAWSNPWGGNGGNLFDFIDKCDELNYRVDFVALHCYWGGKSPQSWYNDLKYIHERTGRPLWITEWNNGANWTNEWWPDASHAYTDANAQKQLNDLKGILEVLDTASFVERYFIYNWVEDCRAIVLNGELTLAGEYYAQNRSQIAYNSKNEVIPRWNYTGPELSHRYFRLAHSNRLAWTNENGELVHEYRLERKINNGDYEVIYSSSDISKQFYLDPIDPETGGTITYRLTFLTAGGNVMRSNEITVHQTAGENEVQTGNFVLENMEEQTSLFSVKFDAVPLVFLGAPTFNNDIPLTWRVNSVSAMSFGFELDPWRYVNSPSIATPERLGALALAAGNYDFGGLKAEAKAVDDVTRNWMTVNFDAAFEKEPVVFCTLSSRGNAYPLTVAVRNVTTTGFEMCLKNEEAVETSLVPETVGYFAIEPGQGEIDGKRITVGKDYNGMGIGSLPVEIPYDTTYSEPALFAGLLSAEDDFASTLRYSLIKGIGFKFFKIRELSGGESSIKEDSYGWMVMDIAADQPGVGTSVVSFKRKTFSFYPNPARETVFFNLEKPTRIAVFDLSGRKLLENVVINEMDVSPLLPGLYILRAEGYSATKLMKVQ